MNLKKLLYFKTIVEQGQISRAARVLNISQPPLSQRLKELEDDLGVTLIERSGNNWVVTTAGKALYQRALQIFDLVDDIPAEIQRAGHAVEGLAVIGCTTLSLSVLLRFIPHFHERHPNISLRLFIEDSSLLLLKLREHVYDFCIMYTPHFQSGFLITPLPPSPTCVIVPHSLATKAISSAARDNTPLDPNELHRTPVVMLRRQDGGGLYGQIMGLFSSTGVEPKIVMDCPACSAIIRLVENGFQALAIVPKSEIPERIYSSHLVCSLPDDFPNSQPCIAQLENRYLSRPSIIAYEELKAFVAQEAAS